MIAEDQFGYLKGRKVSTLLRIIDDVTDYCKQSDSPGLLLAVDFSHAFDCISKDYMLQTFKLFGFGDGFLRWVSTLMNDAVSCVGYCGWISESFPVEAGIRQGCPFSPLAFVLAIEVLAITLRGCSTIKGIKIKQNRPEDFIKLLTAIHADDITLFLEDEKDMRFAISIPEDFADISGLIVNKLKTEAMWLGRYRNRHQTFLGIKWTSKLKILGIIFSNDKCAPQIDDNWVGRVENCKRIIS